MPVEIYNLSGMATDRLLDKLSENFGVAVNASVLRDKIQVHYATEKQKAELSPKVRKFLTDGSYLDSG
jgi:hypothetical protein